MIATATISATTETPKQALKLPPWQSLHGVQVHNRSENDCWVSFDRVRWDTVKGGETRQLPITSPIAVEKCDDGGATVLPGTYVWIRAARQDKPAADVVVTVL